jgi:hypothetical protein
VPLNKQVIIQLPREMIMRIMGLDHGVFVHKKIVSAVKWVQSVSDAMSYILLRGQWCNVIPLNVNAKREYNLNDGKLL